MEGPGFWAAAVAAAALVGMSKGGLPVVGMLGVPILSLTISPIAAAGLLLPVYIASDMVGLWAYRRAFDRRVVAIVTAGATLGIGLGWLTARAVPEAAVTLLVGLIGGAFASFLLTRRGPPPDPRPARVAPGLVWGTVTGFTSFVSHSGAPPYQIYVLPLGLPKAVFAGTATVSFAYINAVKLLPYWALGQLDAANLRVAALLMPVAAAAVLAGVRLVRILPEKLFFRLVVWALLAISLKLIADGWRAL
jgi:uncharacterized membrane protein YfcA